MSGDSPRVSVLMPVLNPHPIYFREAVESVLAQTFTDWELLIVEAPGDSSAAPLLSSYNDPRIRHVVMEPGNRFTKQLNFGLQLAKSDIVARMDADDRCFPTRLETQFKYLGERSEIAVVGSALRIIDSAGQTRGGRKYPVPNQEVSSALKRYNPLAHPAVMFRKAAVLAVGGYHETRFKGVEDYDLWCRLNKEGYQMANLREELLEYRVHDSAWKVRGLHEMLRATIDLKLRFYGDCLDTSAYLRVQAERLLLCFPSGVVLRLFQWVQFQPQAKKKCNSESAV